MDRTKCIQLIHIAKSQLHLDDEVYRSILRKLTDKNSLKEMSFKQLSVVLNHMKELGFKIESKNGRKMQKLRPQLELIRSLWIDLHRRGAVRDGSENALNHFIKRMVKIERLQWLDESRASKIIEHLKKWLSRGGKYE